MNLDYLLLPAAIIGLWIPSAVFSSSAIRSKLRQASRRHHDGLFSLARSYLNWIDLARGAGFAWLLTFVLSNVPTGKNELALVYMIAKFAVFAVGVFAQCILIGKPVRIIGPVFYLSGISLVVSGPQVAGFALFLALTCALMFQRLSYAFVFTPVFLILFSKVFGQLGLAVVVNAGLFALPIFLSFAMNVRLSYVRRPLSDASGNGEREADEVPAEEESAENASITPIFGASAATINVSKIQQAGNDRAIAQFMTLGSDDRQNPSANGRSASMN